jgi:hypothetical protein
MSENRVIPLDELCILLCQDRSIEHKFQQVFTNAELKKRHDEVNFNREIDDINNGMIE